MKSILFILLSLFSIHNFITCAEIEINIDEISGLNDDSGQADFNHKKNVVFKKLQDFLNNSQKLIAHINSYFVQLKRIKDQKELPPYMNFKDVKRNIKITDEQIKKIIKGIIASMRNENENWRFKETETLTEMFFNTTRTDGNGFEIKLTELIGNKMIYDDMQKPSTCDCFVQ